MKKITTLFISILIVLTAYGCSTKNENIVFEAVCLPDTILNVTPVYADEIDGETLHLYRFTKDESGAETIEEYVPAGEETVEEEVQITAVSYGEYVGVSPEEFEKIGKELGLNPVYASEKDAYSNSISEGQVVWHGSGDYVPEEDIRYGVSLGVRPHDYTHYLTGVFVDIDGAQDVVNAGNIAITDLGTVIIATHNYTYGDSWIANYEVGDTVVSNAGTYVIDEIGYADVTTDFMIYNGNDIYNDAAYQVAMHTCVHGRPDINWVAVGHFI